MLPASATQPEAPATGRGEDCAAVRGTESGGVMHGSGSVGIARSTGSAVNGGVGSADGFGGTVGGAVNGGGVGTVDGASPDRGGKTCQHCGSPSGEADFCGQGCAYAYRLLHENSWQRFYRMRDRVIAPVGEAAFTAESCAWLEKSVREAEAIAPQDNSPQMELVVQGASCAACLWLIEKVFAEHCRAGVIHIDLHAARLHVQWQRGAFDAVGFAVVLQRFGYTLCPATAEAQVQGGLSQSRRMLRRIGLCAAFQMNVMLYTLPSYFGMGADFEYAWLFYSMSMLFATLSLWAGGGYFIRRAWEALRRGEISLDLPLSLGICGSYAGSVVGWLMGREEYLYFDFVSTFILLMLVGRWAKEVTLERNRRRLSVLQPVAERVRLVPEGSAFSESHSPQSAVASPLQCDAACGVGGADFASGEKCRDEAPAANVAAGAGHPAEVGREQLRAGQRFYVGSGQRVPVEAVLESAEAVFDLAWINGEPQPRVFLRGQHVPAGAHSLGLGDVMLAARESWQDSLLSQLLRPVQRPTAHNCVVQAVIRGYLIGIIITAFLAGIGWGLLAGWWQAGAVVTAVLVVSCPCALGLAFPLADELAVVALRRLGVFVRTGDLWTRLAKVRHVVFDKTGTLTLETPRLKNPEAVAGLSPLAAAALHALVRENPHPVARSLYRELLVGGVGDALQGDIAESVGNGVSLGQWSLGRAGWNAATGDTGGQVLPFAVNGAAATGGNLTNSDEARHGVTVLAQHGVTVARFYFSESVRADAAAEIAALRGQGLSCAILSGDAQEKVDAMAAELGLAAGEAHGGLSPQAKAEWIERNGASQTLMVGDGANDSLAFDSACCRGTPVVYRSVLEQKSDFYYLGQGIAGIRALFDINRARRRAHGILLVFMIVYNVLTVAAAVAGWINPLVAAILMPLSSLATLAIVAVVMRGVWRRDAAGR